MLYVFKTKNRKKCWLVIGLANNKIAKNYLLGFQLLPGNRLEFFWSHVEEQLILGTDKQIAVNFV